MADAHVFAEAADEDQRLRARPEALDPLTARLFARAGLAAGMRVLDLGSGAGHVALLAAEAAGPEGASSASTAIRGAGARSPVDDGVSPRRVPHR